MQTHNINILLASPGDRHEDCIPEFFISLDKLSETIDKIRMESDFDGKNDYYIFVLCPNKPIILNKHGDCDIWVSFDKDDIYIGYNQCTYEQLEEKIISVANEKMKL